MWGGVVKAWVTTVYQTAPDDPPKLSDLKPSLLSIRISIPCSPNVISLLGSCKQNSELSQSYRLLAGWLVWKPHSRGALCTAMDAQQKSMMRRRCPGMGDNSLP